MPRLTTLCVCILTLPSLGASASAPVKPAPVRVLLVAGAATREYQFVRNLLAREADQGQVKVAVYLQTPPGRTEPREGVVQSATLLKTFPETMLRKRTEDLGDQPDEMASYDVVVAFDPDWAQLSDDQQKLLKGWVEDGGGLVLIAGPVNTPALARKNAADKFKPVLDLFPVTLGDGRPGESDDATDKAFPLHFPNDDKTTPNFMKLDPDGNGLLAGWDGFFYGSYGEAKNPPLERGFYHVYPVEALKPAATVLAAFADPKAKLADSKEAPFLVTSPADKGRVVYLGSGEMWRLRSYREAFHDRFWAELIHYAAAAPRIKVPEKTKQSPDELSQEIDALRLLVAFDFTEAQRKELAESVSETTKSNRARSITKVSHAYLHALSELRDTLADGSDDDDIDDKEIALAKIEAKEHPGLDDDVDITTAARKQAWEVFRTLKPSQLMNYLRQQEDDATDPEERLVKALTEVRDLKGGDDKPDAIAAEIAGVLSGADVKHGGRQTFLLGLRKDLQAALAGVDATKARQFGERIAALLIKAHGLTADEFQAQKAELEKTAAAITDSVGPDDVLRNRAQYALAELLSNPQLEAALKASK